MNKNKNQRTLLLLTALMSILLSACGSRTPTLTGDMVITNVAQTVAFDLTQIAALQPTSTPTLEATPTSAPSPTPSATFTPTGPTPTSTSEFSVDSGVWVSSEPPDGSYYTPNQTFVMSVTLMNLGDTTWTTAYYIKFTGGDRMDAPEKIFMPYVIPPGKNVIIPITFKAPESLGLKRSNWALVNGANKEFAIFWCEIEVASEPLPTNTPSP